MAASPSAPSGSDRALAGYGPYFACVGSTLSAALSVFEFPSMVVELHSKPEVEVGTSPDVLLNPIKIAKDDQECVQIEPSVNSVRVNVKWRQSDDVDRFLAGNFTALLGRRADAFGLLRRKPVPGWDISFLITADHCSTMRTDKIVEWVVDFIQEISRDMKDLKLALNSRARAVARQFLTACQ